MQRRLFIKALLSVACLPLNALAAVWNKSAFEAKTLKEAQSSALIAQETLSKAIIITAADRAENGAVVQIEVISQIPNTSQILIFVENNPTPLIAQFTLQNGALAHVVTRIKMAQSSPVKVVVKANNQTFYNIKEVIVLEDGCGGTDAEGKFESSMKMRAKLLNQQAEIKAIIAHPMTTGRSKNVAGEVIPAHFIQQITAMLNGQSILEMQCGTAISKNPYLTFYVDHAQLGDVLQLSWQDNQGYTGQGEIKVTI